MLNLSKPQEWWVEVEIVPKENNLQLIDKIIIEIHQNFLASKKQEIKAWHFFREPTLRLRIEVEDKEKRDILAEELKNYLNSLDEIEEHYFANHGKRIDNLDKGYKGERETYKRMWPYQKKLWEIGSEMAIEAIKEFTETGKNDPSREFQLERIFHLLFNQLNPLSLNEVELYQRCANNRILVWSYIQSKQLHKQLLEKIKKQN